MEKMSLINIIESRLNESELSKTIKQWNSLYDKLSKIKKSDPQYKKIKNKLSSIKSFMGGDDKGSTLFKELVKQKIIKDLK